MSKRVIVTERLRIPPACGFSWLDRRFIHEFAPKLNRDAVYLYLFLTAVSDKSGLSYYRDATVGNRTGISLPQLPRAREELLRQDLIAYEQPLYQVLALPKEKAGHSPVESAPVLSLGELMTSLAKRQNAGVGQ